MATKAGDTGLFIDYYLNLLGVRVWKDACQLISRSGPGWSPLGGQRPLPVRIPLTPAETTEDWVDELRMTAYQYQIENPDSDLAEVLSQTRDFFIALKNRLPHQVGGGGVDSGKKRRGMAPDPVLHPRPLVSFRKRRIMTFLHYRIPFAPLNPLL
jgi:hypothetical protein